MKSVPPASGQVVTDDYVILGRISGVHGVHGWVKVHSDTRSREDILQYRNWQVRRPEGWRTMQVVEGRAQGSGLVVARLEGIEDRDQARALTGAEIAIRRHELPPAGAGEFYWADLEGLKVVNLEAVELGTVTHLFATGANDVLVVNDGERERLIPFTRDAVKNVDLVARVIRVDWDADF